MILPIGLLLGSFYLVEKFNEKNDNKTPVEKSAMKPQPKYSKSAIDLLTFTENGVRTFKPHAMGDATEVFAASGLELVTFNRGPSDVLIYRLIPRAWGTESAQDAITKARSSGVHVLASISVALSDPREVEMFLLFGGNSSVKYANESSVFAVLAVPDKPKEIVAEVKEEEPTPIVSNVAKVMKRNGKADKPAPFTLPVEELKEESAE